MKTLKQVMKKRFRPNAPASQPLIGRTIAFETRYEVNTQVLWSLLAPRLPAMYGRATLAMLVSSTSMNAARATTTAISQGLNLGRQTSWSSVRAAPNSSEVHVGHDIHTRSKLMVPILSRFKNNLHRNPLDNFHVVAGGIFGRKQTEERTGCSRDAVHVAFESCGRWNPREFLLFAQPACACSCVSLKLAVTQTSSRGTTVRSCCPA